MAAIPLDRDWYWGFMDNCHVSGVKLYQPNPTYLAWLEKASTFPMRSIFVEQEQVIALGKSTARLLEKIAQDKVQKPASVSPQPTPTEENDIPKAVKVLNSDNKEPDLLVAQEAEWDQLTRACKAAETLARLSELAIPDHVLSVDILCCIFRSAACSSSAEAKMLSLVSREVQTWVDPFVFRYLAPKDNYTAFYKTLKTKVSPRLVRAKDVHFKGLTVVHLVLEDSEDSRLARLIKTVPALRSLSSIADILRYYRYSKVLRSQISRLHIDGWSPTLVSLADGLIASNTLTHLSLKVNTNDVESLSRHWDWTPLRKLSKLEYFLLHTNPARFCHTVSEKATEREYHILFTDRLHPVLPDALHVLIWVLPPIIKHSCRYPPSSSGLECYKRLLDGTAIPCMVVAFQAERVGCCETSESAGAGREAFVYPDVGVYPAPGNEGIGWLESDLCERALAFLKEREERKRRENESG